MGNVILGWVICSEGVWTWSISLGELLDTGVNFVAALVTAAALVAGFRQMKMTWENDSDARLQDRYFEFQQKAYLVDAYVTRHPKQKRLPVIANQTDGAIRNVKLHVKWPDLDGRPLECNQLDDFSLHCVPKKDLCWKVLPQGQWFVSPNSEITYATWTYPQLDGDGKRYSPEFFEHRNGAEKGREFAVVFIEFTDAYGNQWQRVFDVADHPDSLTPGMILLDSPDKRLRKVAERIQKATQG